MSAGDASNGYGDVVLSATDSLAPAPGPLVNVTGNNITLTSSAGAIGTSAAPLVIEAQGPVNVSALEDIDLTQGSGNLQVGQIVSTTGDVTLDVPSGSIVNASGTTWSDEVDSSQSQQVWQNLNLTDPAANEQQAVTAFENEVDADYLAYWQLLDNGGAQNGVFTLNAQAVAIYNGLAALALGVTNPTPAQVQAYANTQYQTYVSFFNQYLGPNWMSAPEFETYDSTFLYVATAQQVSDLESNAAWTTSELMNPVALVAVGPAAGTPVGIWTSNISGANVTLVTSGSIGQTIAPVAISLADLQSGNLTPAQETALANATAPGDVVVTSTGVEVSPNSQVFISATGDLSANAGGPITIQGTTPNLTLNAINAGGAVNITAQGSILSSGTGTQITTPGSIVLKAGTGSVGSTSTPVKVNVGGQVNVYTPPGNSHLTGTQTTQLAISASTGSPSTYGESVTFTATVSDTGAATGVPTGSVEFYDGTTDLGPGSALSGSGTSATSTFTISTLDAGVHASISAVYVPNGNYVGSSGSLSLTVNPAPLTITADNASKTYGHTAAFGATAFTETGLVNGDSITGVAEASAGSPISATVGTYNIVPFAAAGSGLSNYTITYVNGTLTVSPAPLTITANDATKTYGQTATFAATAFTETGLVTANGDTITGVTETSTGAPVSAQVGTYPIVPSAATGNRLSNYTITYDSGTLTVNPALLTITANNESKPFGTLFTFSSTAFTETGLVTVNGDTITGVTETSAGAPASAPPGTYPIVPSAATGNRLGNYTITYVNGTLTVNQSIIILDPTAGGALSLSGNASIALAGGIFVDSSSSSALSASGNPQLKALVIDVHGGVQKNGNANFSPAPTTGAATLPDPLASLAEPSTSGLTNYGAENLSGNSSATIQPGIYSAISASGNGTLTLSSGVYIIEDGGFSVTGKASVSGTGVMIFNAGSKYPSTGGTYGSISLSGNGSYSLSPPTSGTYAGIVIFQPMDNTNGLTVSGNASGMTGVIYAPAAQLTESGNAQLNAAIVVDTMTVSGQGIANAVAPNSSAGTVAYTPAQIRDAYGLRALALDGIGQTIAIVDAYNDPSIFQSLDAFDAQFGQTDSGPTLYEQYGPASSFLTVLNQYGQATSLPSTDPNGPGTDNWEVEEALDVEWTHAIAPGAQIILVEANSQSLSDLMASVAKAAGQPGVSVVSMSWGFPEGQAVFAADEATYDGVFNVPGVTFVASTGDYGAADPEYPAFSPNVVAVGGTSLTLNADNSYNGEAGWDDYADSLGMFIGSGGGISQYEPEPAYQQGAQSTGYRTTPDVSLVADPATGAWIADTYNLSADDPFEVAGGTSLSAPAWAGLIALVNEGRAAWGEAALNTVIPTDTQQALYSLPQSNYNVIASGSTMKSGYAAQCRLQPRVRPGNAGGRLVGARPDRLPGAGNHLHGPDGEPVAECHAVRQMVE